MTRRAPTGSKPAIAFSRTFPTVENSAVTTPSAPADAWWCKLYDDRLAELFLVRSGDEVRAAVDFLVESLGVSAGDHVFDQCCGLGTLSVPLARLGLHVVGIDQCGSYVHRAADAAAAAGVVCTFLQADAFAFIADPPCHAALNWWTSFGYADDEWNLRMLRRAFESLRPGGRFVLDFQNMARVIAGFRPCMVRRKATEEGDVLLIRESTLDLPGGYLRQSWTYVLPHGCREVRESSVRLYLPHAIAGMLAACGFVDITFRGDVTGEPLGADSPRCIARARRSER